MAFSSDNSSPAAQSYQAELTPVLEFLRLHAPFNQLAAEHLDFLASHLTLAFYAKGESIAEPDRGRADTFYVIKQGRVRGEAQQHEGDAEEGAWELVGGECFPLGALLANRPVRTVHRAVEDSFCFELERKDFDTLLAASPEFHDFCTRRLANLLDLTLRSVQADLATEVSGDTALRTLLESLVHRSPVTCAPQTPIQRALETMHAAHVGSIIVTDTQSQPIGVFTLHDLLRVTATSALAFTSPIEQVMSAPALTLSPRDSAYQAALLMTRHGIGHVCLVDSGRLVGVVSERDLFSLQRIGLVRLSRSITQATDIPTLARLGKDVHRLIDQMLVQGASVAQLMQIIAALNDSITRRIIYLYSNENGVSNLEFTWLSFGSEGRQEQTLKTDQDNGMLFVPPTGKPADAVRARLLPLARRINEALDQCGFPLCRGNIMASNPECCLSLEEWKERFATWIDQGTPDHLLKASIYFDLRPLHGDERLAAELKHWVAQCARDSSRFRRLMAENALRNQPPLGLVRDFVLASGGEHAHTLDLKMRGAIPFVDGARLVALAQGITETNTFARLRAAAKSGKLRTSEAEAWCDAYSFIQLMRMRAHQRQQREYQALDNHINPDDLNDLDRRILKEALRQARKLQTYIALEYQI